MWKFKDRIYLNETGAATFNEKESEKEEIAMRKEQKENVRVKDEFLSQRLLTEIYAQEDSLSDIQWISVTQLEDRDLLSNKKDIHSLDSRFSSLREGVTNLIVQLPTDLRNRAEIISERSKKEKERKGILDSYKKKLHTEIADRNISEENLKNSPNLMIKLQKFSGYNYVIDIWWTYGVVVSMFDFHRNDRGSNPGRGGKIHNVYDYTIEWHPWQVSENHKPRGTPKPCEGIWVVRLVPDETQD